MDGVAAKIVAHAKAQPWDSTSGRALVMRFLWPMVLEPFTADSKKLEHGCRMFYDDFRFSLVCDWRTTV